MAIVHDHITLETTILVAVWDNPAIFQGCFSITSTNGSAPVFLLFRCEYQNWHQQDTVEDEFSADTYHFTHLYNEKGLLHLETLKEEESYASYVLKYALYKTLLEMRVSRKQRFHSLDNVAMKAMIKQIEPLLQLDELWGNLDPEIGFAATMDFYPHEQMGKMAVNILLKWGDSKASAKN